MWTRIRRGCALETSRLNCNINAVREGLEEGVDDVLLAEVYHANLENLLMKNSAAEERNIEEGRTVRERGATQDWETRTKRRRRGDDLCDMETLGNAVDSNDLGRSLDLAPASAEEADWTETPDGNGVAGAHLGNVDAVEGGGHNVGEVEGLAGDEIELK